MAKMEADDKGAERKVYESMPFNKEKFKDTFETKNTAQFDEMTKIFEYGNNSKKVKIMEFFFEECSRLRYCFDIPDNLSYLDFSMTLEEIINKNPFPGLTIKISKLIENHKSDLFSLLKDSDFFWRIFQNKLNLFECDFRSRNFRVQENSSYRVSSFSDFIVGPAAYAKEVIEEERERVNGDIALLKKRDQNYRFDFNAYPLAVRNNYSQHHLSDEKENDNLRRLKALAALNDYYDSDAGIKRSNVSQIKYCMTNILFPVIGLAVLWNSNYVPGSVKVSATVGVGLAMLHKAKSVQFEPKYSVDMATVLGAGIAASSGCYCLSRYL